MKVVCGCVPFVVRHTPITSKRVKLTDYKAFYILNYVQNNGIHLFLCADQYFQLIEVDEEKSSY